MSVTGFQVVVVKKRRPKVLNAGQPPIAREMITPARDASRAVAAEKHSILKSWSDEPRLDGPTAALVEGTAEVVMEPV